MRHALSGSTERGAAQALVRAPAPGDFPHLGRILWNAFGPKLRFFVGDDPVRGAGLLSDLLSGGAIRADAVRVAALPSGAAPTVPVGLCLVRLPDQDIFRTVPALRAAWRRFGPWRGLRAFAGLCLCDEPARPGSAVLSLLAVAPEARGQGIGSALLQAVEAQARAAVPRLHVLSLDVIEHNPARRLYERHGFRVTRAHRLPGPLARMLGYDAYDHMEKRLA